jgi:hypothetical protein
MPCAQSAHDHARALIYYVCCLTGSTSFSDEIDTQEESSLGLAIEQRNTPQLFECLVSAFNFQGIADEIASNYIEQHGLPSWADLEAGLSKRLLPETERLLGIF